MACENNQDSVVAVQCFLMFGTANYSLLTANYILQASFNTPLYLLSRPMHERQGWLRRVVFAV